MPLSSLAHTGSIVCCKRLMEDRYGVHKIVGRSKAIRDVLIMVERAAPSRSTVLITGESGTGKELVARAIHYTSPVKINPLCPSTAWL